MSGIYQVAVYGDMFNVIYQFDNESRANGLIQFLNSQLDDETETEFDMYMMKFHTWEAFMIQKDTSVFQQFKEHYQEHWTTNYVRCTVEDIEELWQTHMGIGEDREHLGIGLEVVLHGLNDEYGVAQEILLQESDYAVGLLAEDIQAVG